MIKRLFSTVFLVSSVSYGAMAELSDIHDPINPSTLMDGISYRVYGMNVPSNIEFLEGSIMQRNLEAVTAWQDLKKALCFEACEILSRVSYFRGHNMDNTPENEADLQRLFWNRIHLLQVWHVKF